MYVCVYLCGSVHGTVSGSLPSKEECVLSPPKTLAVVVECSPASIPHAIKTMLRCTDCTRSVHVLATEVRDVSSLFPGDYGSALKRHVNGWVVFLRFFARMYIYLYVRVRAGSIRTTGVFVKLSNLLPFASTGCPSRASSFSFL